MINRVILVAVVLCIAMIGQAVAEIVDGNKLFADCRFRPTSHFEYQSVLLRRASVLFLRRRIASTNAP